MIGTKLGFYEIVEQIGQGGMATVYRAYFPPMNRFIAIKIIAWSISGDSQAVERFQNEARLITRLEHPHLLQVYDYNCLNDPPYIVMRYLEGGTLWDLLEFNRPFSLAATAFIFQQITSGLDYAHGRGVFHRDIKPSNIFIDDQGKVFLADFGIARTAST